MVYQKMPTNRREGTTAIGCRNGGIRVLIFLLVIPILILILAFVILWLPLPGLASEPGSRSRNLVAAITVGIFGLGLIVALVAYLLKVLKTASHCMDKYFLAKGLVISKAYSYGRSFHGAINDVQIEGVLLPSYYLQPWRLNVTMHKGIGFLGTLGNRKTIVNRYCKPYHPEGPLSSYFTVSTEPQKMNQFLKDPLVEKTIQKMIQGHTKQDTWELRLYEKKVEFKSCQYEFHPEEKESSLDAFFSLFQKIA
ncbi:MAG: hypothetical protein KAH01_02595 [Caldisericia bacterium]|nr:hypothetical protein [Caldisericia bacterium]